jgi:hypothetical protein
MKGYDNSGRLISEINSFRTSDGKCISTNTVYNSVTGRPTSQNILVSEPNGKVSTTTTIGGKLLP